MQSKVEVRADVTWDVLAKSYDGMFQTPVHRWENDELYRRLHACGLNSFDRVADIGCGTGLLLDGYPISAATYQGVDISEGMLREARSKHPHHVFLKGSASQLPIGSRSVDFAVSTFAITYFPDIGQALAEMNRVLRKGGNYFVTFLTRRRVEIDAVHANGFKLPTNLLGPAEIRNAFARAGFKSCYVEGFRALPERVLNSTPKLLQPFAFKLDTWLAQKFPERAYYLNAYGVK